MFSFYFKQDDTVKIGEETYELNVSFDNVLKVIDLMKEKRMFIGRVQHGPVQTT